MKQNKPPLNTVIGFLIVRLMNTYESGVQKHTSIRGHHVFFLQNIPRPHQLRLRTNQAIPIIINAKQTHFKTPTKVINPPRSGAQPTKSTEQKATDSNCQTRTQQPEAQQPYSAKTDSAREHDNVSSLYYHHCSVGYHLVAAPAQTADSKPESHLTDEPDSVDCS